MVMSFDGRSCAELVIDLPAIHFLINACAPAAPLLKPQPSWEVLGAPLRQNDALRAGPRPFNQCR